MVKRMKIRDNYARDKQLGIISVEVFQTEEAGILKREEEGPLTKSLHASPLSWGPGQSRQGIRSHREAGPGGIIKPRRERS